MRKLKITEIQRLSTDDFKEVRKIPLVIVLDNIRSLHNVGAVFRTSDAFLIQKIYLCGITPIPPHPDIHKTALGAEYSIEWIYVESTIEAINLLKKDNFSIWAVEQVEGSTLLDRATINPNEKYALVFGNEVKGVQQEVINLCDGSIEIPQFGTKHSLNISVSAGIVIWTFAIKLIKDRTE